MHIVKNSCLQLIIQYQIKSQKSQDVQTTPLLNIDNKKTPKRPSKNTDDVPSHTSLSLQNTFKKRMEIFKTFTQAVKRKFEPLENLILNLSTKDKQSHGREPNLANAFFNTQFNYCPTIWMFHSRSLNNKISKIHECCLRMIYAKQSNFEELLVKDNSVCIHYRNI